MSLGRLKASLAYKFLDRQSEKTLLLLHGFLGSKEDWDFLANFLDCNLLAVDLPGHGESLFFEESAYDLNFFLEELRFLIDSLIKGPVTLLGYSMGGRLAMHFALKYPDYLEKLILESASPGIASTIERKERLKLDCQRREQVLADFPAFLDSWYNALLFSSLRQREAFPKLLESRLKGKPHCLSLALYFFSPALLDSLWHENFSLPLDYLVGEKDEKYQKIAKQMQRTFRNITVTNIFAAGHNAHFENTELFARSIRL